jgi:hypothetical protein
MHLRRVREPPRQPIGHRVADLFGRPIRTRTGAGLPDPNSPPRCHVRPDRRRTLRLRSGHRTSVRRQSRHGRVRTRRDTRRWGGAIARGHRRNHQTQGRCSSFKPLVPDRGPIGRPDVPRLDLPLDRIPVGDPRRLRGQSGCQQIHEAGRFHRALLNRARPRQHRSICRDGFGPGK